MNTNTATPTLNPASDTATQPTTIRTVCTAGEVTARALYAHHLAVLRKKTGLSLVERSDRCHYEQSYLHRLETADRLGNLEVAETLDRFYGTGHLLAGLWRLAKREAKQLAAGGMEALEATATSIQEYALTTVPDLLKTPAYAEEQFATTSPQPPELLVAQVDALLRRQARLTDTTSKPVRYRAVLDNVVFHRAARNPATWAAQLDHLITIAHHPGITLQVLPLHAGPQALRGPIQLLSFRVSRALACAHNTLTRHVTDDPDDVDQLRQTYDNLRDAALTPAQTIEHLHTLRTTQGEDGAP